MSGKKKILRFAILLFAVPAVIIIGTLAAGSRAYVWLSICVAVLSCVPFFIAFEKKSGTGRMLILAVMVALSVLGRFAFSALPHFKPVTAIVVIAGIYLGAESGFLCGALSAVLSNIIFGQGPWTPFQMFSWGLIGFLAAVTSPLLKKSKLALAIYGVFSGILFSLLMDGFSALWAEGKFSLSRYGAFIVAALPVTAIYAVSNVIFLLALSVSMGEKLERITKKYGI